MKMSKTCKRLNEKLLAVLNQLIEESKQINGFSHVSHIVKFDCFPGSLLVTCHFSDAQQLDDARANQTEANLQKRLHQLLLKQGIVLKNPKQHLNLTGPT